MSIAEIVAAALVIISTVCVLATMLLQLRAPDALTRANLLGPLVCVAFPFLVMAQLVHSWSTSGFDLNDFLRAILAIASVWVIASVASFIIGRSIYGVTVVDKVPPEMK